MADTLAHQRWREAVPKLRMALAEVGHDTRLGWDGESIELLGAVPDDVMEKAFQVCGIGDLYARMTDDLERVEA